MGRKKTKTGKRVFSSKYKGVYCTDKRQHYSNPLWGYQHQEKGFFITGWGYTTEIKAKEAMLEHIKRFRKERENNGK